MSFRQSWLKGGVEGDVIILAYSPPAVLLAAIDRGAIVLTTGQFPAGPAGAGDRASDPRRRTVSASRIAFTADGCCSSTHAAVRVRVDAVQRHLLHHPSEFVHPVDHRNRGNKAGILSFKLGSLLWFGAREGSAVA